MPVKFPAWALRGKLMQAVQVPVAQSRTTASDTCFPRLWQQTGKRRQVDRIHGGNSVQGFRRHREMIEQISDSPR
jgi:hypothetical protein